MEYTTPNGKKYKIGTQFKVNDLDIYKIDRIEVKKIVISSLSNAIKEMAWDRKGAEQLFDENTNWKLLKMNTYKTLKGIEYQIGTKFKHRAGQDIFEITNISRVGKEYKYKNLNRIIINQFVDSIIQLEEYLDLATWIIIPEYQSIDPRTIKFDFKNKEVVMANEQESEWVQRAAFANGHTWFDSYAGKPEYTDAKLISFWGDNTITYANNLYWAGEDTRFIRITIQDILTAQTMEEVIEVGDTISSIKYLGGIQGVVTRIANDKYYIGTREDQYYTFDQAKLVSKAMKKEEIIGYELLKDLPGIPAGTKSSPYMGKSRESVVFEYKTKLYHSTEEELDDRNWFKPLYKPSQIQLAISDNKHGQRTATITSTEVRLDYGDAGNRTSTTVKHVELVQIYDVLLMKMSSNSYSITFNSVQVGCQEFSRQDIEQMYKAVQELK